MVAWKEAALRFEMRNVQPLVFFALFSVFEEMWMVCGGSAGAVVPQSGQRYDMVKRSNEGTYFSTFGDVACWREKRCLHFPDKIAFG